MNPFIPTKQIYIFPTCVIWFVLILTITRSWLRVKVFQMKAMKVLWSGPSHIWSLFLISTTRLNFRNFTDVKKISTRTESPVQGSRVWSPQSQHRPVLVCRIRHVLSDLQHCSRLGLCHHAWVPSRNAHKHTHTHGRKKQRTKRRQTQSTAQSFGHSTINRSPCSRSITNQPWSMVGWVGFFTDWTFYSTVTFISSTSFSAVSGKCIWCS